MLKKMLAFLLIFVMVFSCFHGCSSKKEQKNEQRNNQDSVQATGNEEQSEEDTEAVMGRFIEKKVDFPEFEKNENIIKIIHDSNNQIALYTRTLTKYQCYHLNDDMTWESSQPGWLNDGTLSEESIEISDLCYGEDGNYYVCYIDYAADMKPHILKSEDDGKTSQAVEIPYLEEAETTNDYTMYPRIQKLNVLENGNLVLFDLVKNNILLIFSPGGEKLDQLSIPYTEDTACFMTSGNNIITLEEDGKGIIFYNTVSKEIERTLEYDAKENTMVFTEKSDGTIFMGNYSGIKRLSQNGTLWEVTVDGALNSMSMPSISFDELFVTEGEEEQYYASYINIEGGYQLMHYVFDKSISAIPENEITVYSLRENSNIRQAISLFQSKNADVKINYIVAMGEEGGTVSDYIRALNTELLAGNGADILVLDGLPVNSYLEKNVLSDLSDVMEPLEASGEILSNISSCYHTDGKVYQMPLRFGVPIIMGEKDAVTSVKEMDTIISYIDQTTGKPFAGTSTYRELLETYLALYSKDIFKNGELVEDELVTLLIDLKRIADNIKATEYDEDEMTSDAEEGIIITDSIFRSAGLGLVNKKYCTDMTQINGIHSLLIPLAIIKKNGFDYSAINQMFIPMGLIGLNSASKEPDMAKQFIGFLFSQEVQDANLYDGFPVNSKSMDKWIAEEKADDVYSVTDREGNDITGTWPTLEEREGFLKVIQELYIPVEIDQVTFSIIIEEALPYFTGEIEAEQAAAAANSKINTYLAE